MKRIVNSEEMQYCDSNTINHFGIPSLVLMERAALSVTNQMTMMHTARQPHAVPPGRIPPRITAGTRVLIVCGNGNNGADGLAIARLLFQQGCDVTAAQVPDNGKRSKDNQIQRDILQRYGIQIQEHIPQKMQYQYVVDALFGVGLSRPPKGEYAEWIRVMNRLDAYKVAVDMPSGVSSDDGTVYEYAFEADLTVTFAYQKIGQLFYPGCEKCGHTVLAEIGITDDSWLGRSPSCYALEPPDLARLPYRPAHSHKGTFGRLLAAAGSRGMAGAALFSAEAAYRMGCGLVKICTPRENRVILQSTLPEAVLLTGKDKRIRQELFLEAVKWADAIALGPGIGTGRQAQRILKMTLEHAEVPVVIDADGLNILAGHLEWLQRTRAEVIITPHLGEMSRLTGKKVSDIQESLLSTAREFAGRFRITCVLKDARTVTAFPDGEAYINTSGCNAMAKGGSGDVLTGMIGGLLAQGMAVRDAVPMGVYIHGLAGEAAAREKGKYSVLARDMIAAAGSVIKEFQSGSFKIKEFKNEGVPDQ